MVTKIAYPIDETLKDVAENRCPILHAMSILGSKWKLPIYGTCTKKKIPATTNLNAA